MAKSDFDATAYYFDATVWSLSFKQGLRANLRDSLDSGTHRGILMRKVKFGVAFAFACLGATWASATSLHMNDGRTGAAPGEGGWTLNFGAKAFAGGAASVVSNAAKEAVDSPLRFTRHDLASLRYRELWLRARADCVFVSTTTSAGARIWRPNC